MNKTDYLALSLNNIQELIKFTDQKISAVLIVCGIEITIFVEISKEFSLSRLALTSLSIICLLSAILFIIVVLAILFLCIFKVLKPRFAKHYNHKSYSMFYFEHIALNSKRKFKKAAKESNENSQITELCDQLYEISKILHKKNIYCASAMNLLFCSIVIIFIYSFLVYRL